MLFYKTYSNQIELIKDYKKNNRKDQAFELAVAEAALNFYKNFYFYYNNNENIKDAFLAIGVKPTPTSLIDEMIQLTDEEGKSVGDIDLLFNSYGNEKSLVAVELKIIGSPQTGVVTRKANQQQKKTREASLEYFTENFPQKHSIKFVVLTINLFSWKVSLLEKEELFINNQEGEGER